MDYINYAKALLEINKQHREGIINNDLSCELRNFCLHLHEIWKGKQAK